jgi:translation initiation factor 1
MNTTKKNKPGLVYSTEQGRLCPGCGKEKGRCDCRRQKAALPAGAGMVRVSRQTKGRKGSGVTLISGLPLERAGLEAMASRLKKICGSGGTVKDGIIEIQGDQRALLLETLRKEGFQAKQAGG